VRNEKRKVKECGERIYYKNVNKASFGWVIRIGNGGEGWESTTIVSAGLLWYNLKLYA
jgi:hypothetical protein